MGLKYKEIIAREKKILKLRPNHTLKELSEMFGVSRERIRQIHMRGLRRIAQGGKINVNVGPIHVESDIERLNLPIRVYNCLRKSDINTIRNIIESGLFNLLKIKGLGHKGIQEIRDEMRRYGFRVWNV